jgi:hypothetical protein
MRDSMQKAATDFQSSVQSELSKTETDLNKTVEEVVKDPAAPPAAEAVAPPAADAAALPGKDAPAPAAPPAEKKTA